MVLRREEDSIRDLAGVLLAGWLGLGMRRVEVDPAAHLGAVQAGHHPVHNVLQRFVRPATTNIKNYKAEKKQGIRFKNSIFSFINFSS